VALTATNDSFLVKASLRITSVAADTGLHELHHFAAVPGPAALLLAIVCVQTSQALARCVGSDEYARLDGRERLQWWRRRASGSVRRRRRDRCADERAYGIEPYVDAGAAGIDTHPVRDADAGTDVNSDAAWIDSDRNTASNTDARAADPRATDARADRNARAVADEDPGTRADPDAGPKRFGPSLVI